MRYAIFSDVHANLHALQAVLSSCQKESIDQFLCVGDIVGYGAFPNECVTVVNRYATACVAGNHDWACVGLFPVSFFNVYAKDAIAWTSRQLTWASRAYLQSLPLVSQQPFGTLVHGTLDDPGKFEYMMSGCNLQRLFGFMRGSVCFVGHTHVPEFFIQDAAGVVTHLRHMRLPIEQGKKYIVNVGSVGQSRDRNPNAAYCIYDDRERSIEIRRVAYDVCSARLAIIAAGLPSFLGDRLMVGQ